MDRGIDHLEKSSKRRRDDLEIESEIYSVKIFRENGPTTETTRRYIQ